MRFEVADEGNSTLVVLSSSDDRANGGPGAAGGTLVMLHRQTIRVWQANANRRRKQSHKGKTAKVVTSQRTIGRERMHGQRANGCESPRSAQPSRRVQATQSRLNMQQNRRQRQNDRTCQRPGEHGSQLVAPVALLKVPTAQSVHSV